MHDQFIKSLLIKYENQNWDPILIILHFQVPERDKEPKKS